MKRRMLTGATVLALLVTACGSVPRTTAAETPAAETTTTIAPEPEVVSALDGSASFSVHPGDNDQLVRLDPETREATSSWALEQSDLSISAVAPKGRWVALTDRHPGYEAPRAGESTRLVVFDPAVGTETHRLDLSGDVRPEAFSVDGRFLFALDHRGDHYRVQTITVATGARFDTNSRDKTIPREDMRGTSVRGVLNADDTLLATLYRNPGNADEPAFVHVLDLVHGWAYCADLPPPFGTGPAGTDQIALTPRDTVIVTTTDASRTAEIHIDEVLEPSSTPVTVQFRDGTIPALG